MGQFGAQGVNFAASLLLALFMGRRDFGLVDAAAAVILVLDSLVDFGIGMAIIQRKETAPAVLDTAFTINMVLASIACGVMVGIGCIVDGFDIFGSDSHDSALILWQLSGVSIFTGLSTIPRALLLRDLRLGAVARLTFATSATRGGVSVGFAAAGYGAQSLVFGAYAGSAAAAAMAYWLARARLRFRWGDQWRELCHFGVRLTAFNLVNNALLRADAFVLAPLLGLQDYGVFSLARRLMLQTAEMAGAVLRACFYPMMARVQESRWRLRAIYLRTDQIIVIAMAPALLFLALCTDLLAGSLLDPKWSAAAPAALAVLPAALAMLLLQTPGSLLLAVGCTGELLRWGLVRGGVMLLAWCSAAVLPLPGVLLCLGLALFAALPMLLRGPRRVLGLPLVSLFGSLAAVIPAGAVMAAALLGSRWACARLGLQPLGTVLTVLPAGVVCYAMALHVSQPPAYRYLLRHFAGALHRRARPGAARRAAH